MFPRWRTPLTAVLATLAFLMLTASVIVVVPGMRTGAIWSQSNPTIAYSIDASRAWVSSVVSVAVAAVLALAFLGVAIHWWKRLITRGPVRADGRPSDGLDGAAHDSG